MKVYHVIAGFVAGVLTSVLVLKKFTCCKHKKGKRLSEAQATIDSLRSSVDSIKKQLNERIESEQTFAAKCQELNTEISAQAAKIKQLEDLCAIQEAHNKKLESKI